MNHHIKLKLIDYPLYVLLLWISGESCGECKHASPHSPVHSILFIGNCLWEIEGSYGKILRNARAGLEIAKGCSAAAPWLDWKLLMAAPGLDWKLLNRLKKESKLIHKNRDFVILRGQKENISYKLLPTVIVKGRERSYEYGYGGGGFSRILVWGMVDRGWRGGGGGGWEAGGNSILTENCTDLEELEQFFTGQKNCFPKL